MYRVKPLPQSLLALVWNFGSLKTQKLQSAESEKEEIIDTETEYIRKMVEKMVGAF